MIDRSAFHRLSSGLYIVCSESQGKLYGCVINTLLQLTSKPFQLSIALNKDNATTRAVQESGRFTASVVDETMDMETIGRFGFKSSRDVDKFADFTYEVCQSALPYIEAHCCAWFSCRVVNSIDVGTHILFVGEVEESATLDAAHPMTYEYYHSVKGGKTPPKASAYTGEEGSEEVKEVQETASQRSTDTLESGALDTAPRYGWQCRVCGYIVEMTELPDNFMCPVCGVGKEMFDRIEL